MLEPLARSTRTTCWTPPKHFPERSKSDVWHTQTIFWAHQNRISEMPGEVGHAMCHAMCQVHLDQLTNRPEHLARLAKLPSGHTATIHQKRLNHLPDTLEPTAGHVGTTTQTLWNHALEMPESGPGHTGIMCRNRQNHPLDTVDPLSGNARTTC